MNGFLYLFFALPLFLLSSCEYTSRQPIEQWRFGGKQTSKAEMISVLDRFAVENGFRKTQEGGEGMLPERSLELVFAVYQDDVDLQFQVQNVLDEQCLSAAIYYFGSGDKLKARGISSKLRAFLKDQFQLRLSFYEDQHCRVEVK